METDRVAASLTVTVRLVPIISILVKARVLGAIIQIFSSFLKILNFLAKKNSELKEILKNHQKCSHFR